MPAYIVSEIDVTDPVKYEDYKKLVPASIAQYGGRYLTRGGATTTLEGDWAPSRVVILEFPDADRARAWYASPEYTRARAARAGASDAKIIVVEGMPG
ncbi:MAG: DUF1330 domain-containing protein [Rhodospirillaceae bacterium]